MTKVSGGVRLEGRRGRAFGRGLTCARPQLCAEDVKDFLEHMAVVRINKGWEFLLPCDSEFVRKHPDVVQRQHMLWTGIQAKYEPVGGAAAAGPPRPQGRGHVPPPPLGTGLEQPLPPWSRSRGSCGPGGAGRMAQEWREGLTPVPPIPHHHAVGLGPQHVASSVTRLSQGRVGDAVLRRMTSDML